MTRRDFIEDSAVGGVAFVACGLQSGVGGAQAQTRRGLQFAPAHTSFAAERERQLDALGDLIDHLDTERLTALIEHGVPAGLPDLRLERC